MQMVEAMRFVLNFFLLLPHTSFLLFEFSCQELVLVICLKYALSLSWFCVGFFHPKVIFEVKYKCVMYIKVT